MKKELTRDIILVIIVIAGVVSFFYNPMGHDMKYIQILMGSIVGFYVGVKNIPVLGVVSKMKMAKIFSNK